MRGTQNETQMIDRMVEILRNVPAKKLMIIELANQIPVVNGEFDEKMLQELAPEIKLASQEALNYGRLTINAVNRLIEIKAI
jgi:hypothetical protein